MYTRKNKQLYKASTLNTRNINTSKIPFVIICWNTLTFIKKLVNQLKKYPNPIILLDNKSSYQPLLEYYKELKEELKDKIDIRLLEQNYGYTVYLQLKHTLPNIFILTDSDIEINEKMPDNFVEIMLKLSNKYKVFKVGLALNIKDKHEFIICKKNENPLAEYQLRYWKDKIINKKYELYNAAVDTTFCLVNYKYKLDGTDTTMPAIRIAGNFTARHLPWYKHTLRDMIPKEELYLYLKDNKSSTLVRKCIRPLLIDTVKHNIEESTLNKDIKQILN